VKNPTSKIKYFAYVRKSSEDKERQAISIPAQKDKINEQFKDLDIEFIEEERSAFTPYNRPDLTQMLERIEKGERQGLIVWHPDRLSRNEIDAGQITYMIRINIIKDLRFCTYHFENTPEGIWMLQMALSQSQYESAKKGRDVRRGLEQKAKMGIYPAPAHVGYMNDKHAEKGNKKVLIDPERFELVRKMFDLMLTGAYTVPQILRIVNDEWKFKMPPTKKRLVPRPMSRVTLYYIFTSPFYYGWFQYPINSKYEIPKDNWYKGIHKPMISVAEYDKIQVLLGRKGRPRPKKHVFHFTGIMRCAECGAMITAEEKIKRQKNGNIHRYIYYHCTKRTKADCSQGSIEEKQLKAQIRSVINDLRIMPLEFHQFAITWFKKKYEKESKNRDAVLHSQQKAYKLCLKKIDGLIDMRASGLIDDDAFSARMTPLKKEKIRLEESLADIGDRVNRSLKLSEEAFTFVRDAIEKFNKGGLETRRRILSTLGSNLMIKAKKLSIHLENSLIPMKIVSKEVKAIHRRFEPLKNPINKGQMEHLYTQNPILLRALNDVRTHLMKIVDVDHFAVVRNW